MKNELRRRLKAERKTIENKADKDKRICSLLIHNEWFVNADTILFYAALDDEINIDECIEYALSDGKKAALPVCLDNNGSMEFYYINSLKDIRMGHFGVREPNSAACTKVNDFSGALCIVPGIAYDIKGYRLGYGKGYYDRFLEKFSFISIGLCYNELVIKSLPAGKYDIPVDYIITQNGLINV